MHLLIFTKTAKLFTFAINIHFLILQDDINTIWQLILH